METVKIEIELDSLPAEIVEGLETNILLDQSPGSEETLGIGIEYSGFECHSSKDGETLASDLVEPEPVGDPTLVTHVLHQQLSTKKGKKKEKLLEERRIKKVKRELENSLKAQTKKTKDLKKTEDNSSALKRRLLFRDESLVLCCEWQDCSVKEARMEDFMRHVSRHVKEAEVIQNPPPLCDSFACLWRGCGFETISSSEMVKHINFHSFHTKIKCHGQNMLEENKVPTCRLEPSQRNVLPDLSGQLRCEWAGCELEGVDWEMAQNFYWHVKSHAEQEEGGEVMCKWRGCSRRNTGVTKLREHLRCHSQEKMVACPNCGGLFSNRVKLQDHCLKQQEGHSFQCTTCEKKFAIERHLRDHMRSHVNHYKCPHCDMTCPTPSTLKNHVKYRHTTEKPFSCEFCEYRGKTKADIKSHVRVHYNEVQQTCPEDNCNFSCRSKITMKQHLASFHQGNRPKYACHVCEEKYFKGSDLTKHLVSAHSFSCPSGHSRFRYTRDPSTDLYRLQTIRFESLHLDENVEVEPVDGGKSGERGRKRKKNVEDEAVKKLKLEELEGSESQPDMEAFDPLNSVMVILTPSTEVWF